MTTTPNSKPAPAGFDQLGLAPELVTAVTGLGYEEPTPIQQGAIPLLIQGRDLLGQAATGTGKTAAFALPLIQRIAGTDDEDPAEEAAATDATPAKKKPSRAKRQPQGVGGLVLVPTRELCMQVAQAMHKYAKGFGLQVVGVYGGASMHTQIRALAYGAQVVVATPGRALDLMQRGHLKLDSLKILVLDEADEMLDMGFADDLDAILSGTPETRQTALFSATMPSRITSIAKRHLRDPARVAIAVEKPAEGDLPRVRQVVYSVVRATKPTVLSRVLDIESPAAALVFCRTRIEVESLVEMLSAYGHRAQALHGGMAQRERDRVMKQLRSGAAELLVATDVAARGLDVEHLTHVVNYDVPAAPETYVHRIGRTGRAGRTGTAITLAEPREHRLIRSIERLTGRKMEIATVPTVADVRARRLDLTRASLRERLLEGDYDDVRVVVESLSEEFGLSDIAAAAVKLAHSAMAGDEADDRDITPAPPIRPEGQGRSWSPQGKRAGGPRSTGPQDRSRGPGRATPGRGGRGGPGHGVTRIFIGAGRQAGIRPGDLVGAITGETGLGSHHLGAIEIADRFSLVEVPGDEADRIITAMRKTTLRGKKVPVRRDREPG